MMSLILGSQYINISMRYLCDASQPKQRYIGRYWLSKKRSLVEVVHACVLVFESEDEKREINSCNHDADEEILDFAIMNLTQRHLNKSCDHGAE